MLQHQFIKFSDQNKVGLISKSTFLVLDHYIRGDIVKTREKWKKDRKPLIRNWTNASGKPQQSEPFNYHIFSDFIRNNGLFDPKPFNLPPMVCLWLDHTMDIKLNAPLMVSDRKDPIAIQVLIAAQHYGKNYPVKPTLRGAGSLYASIQPQLIRRIISERARLVNTSVNMMTDEWVFTLRTLISDAISLIDITLNQLYTKAEYDPLKSWKFDKVALGEKYGRRLNDKFNWIFKISGNTLNIETERPSLESLRKLRNHLMHFDPPSLVVTFEEAAVWLNQILDIGELLIKLRTAVGAEISSELVNLTMQKEVMFNPPNIGREGESLAFIKGQNYYSSCWPNDIPE